MITRSHIHQFAITQLLRFPEHDKSTIFQTCRQVAVLQQILPASLLVTYPRNIYIYIYNGDKNNATNNKNNTTVAERLPISIYDFQQMTLVNQISFF